MRVFYDMLLVSEMHFCWYKEHYIKVLAGIKDIWAGALGW